MIKTVMIIMLFIGQGLLWLVIVYSKRIIHAQQEQIQAMSHIIEIQRKMIRSVKEMADVKTQAQTRFR